MMYDPLFNYAQNLQCLWTEIGAHIQGFDGNNLPHSQAGVVNLCPLYQYTPCIAV